MTGWTPTSSSTRRAQTRATRPTGTTRVAPFVQSWFGLQRYWDKRDEAE